MTNKNTIKKLLAAASTVAILASGSSALAANYIVSGGNGVTSTGAFLSTAGAIAGAPLTDANHTIFMIAALDLTLDIATTGANTHTVNLYGTDARTVSLGAAGQFAITNAVAAADVLAVTAANGVALAAGVTVAPKVNLAFTAAVNKTLTAGSALVNQVDFANKAATLTVSEANFAFTGTIFKSTGGDNGTLALTTSGKITNGVFTAAGNALNDITVADAQTLTLDGTTSIAAGIADIALAGTANLTLADTAKAGNVTAANGTITVVENTEIQGLTTITGTGALSMTKGKVDAVTVDAGGKIDVVSGAITGLTTLTAAGTLNATGASGANANLAGVAVAAAGTVNINDYVTQVGNVNVVAGGTVNVNGANSTVAQVTLGAPASVLNLTAGTVTKVTGNGAANGSVNVLGASTIGQLGDAATLKTLNFADEVTLTLGTVGGTAHQVTDVTSTGNAGTIQFGAATQTLTVSGTKLNANIIGYTTGAPGSGNYGTVVLTGATASFGTFTNISKISMNAAANTAFAFGDGLSSVEVLDFDNNVVQTATIGNISGTAVSGKPLAITSSAGAGANGVVVFTNTNDVTVGQLGVDGGNVIGTVKINGKANVTVAANSATANGSNAIKNLEFGTDAAGTTFTVNKISEVGNGGTITTKSASNGGTLSFLTGGALQADFGGNGNTLTALNYAGTAAAALDVAGKNIFSANITATTDNKLTLTGVGAAGADNTVGTIGSDTAKAASVTFAATGANTLTVGNVWTNETKFAGAGKYAFSNVTGTQTTANGVTTNSLFNLGGFASTVTFNDSTITNTDLTNAATSILVFAGNTTVGKVGTDVARAASITFTGTGKAVALNDSFYSNANTFAQSTYTPSTNLTIGGATTTVDGTTFAVGSGKALTFAGDITNAAAKANGGLVLSLGADKTGVTAKVVGQNITSAENITVVLASTYGSAGTSVDALTFTGSKIGASASKITVSSISDLLKYSLVQGTSEDKLSVVTTKDVANFTDALTKEGLSSDGKSVVKLLENATGNADAFLELLDTADTNKIAAEAANRMAARSNTSTHGAAVTSDNQDTFAQRLNIVSGTSGISSGNENSMMNLGVWGHVSGSKTTQKARKTDSGYTANGNGLTVGVDTKITDMTTIGLAATQSSSTLKFKNTKSGDKAKSANTFFNLYARHELADTWFVQGIAGFGSGSIKATDKRISTNSGSYDTATAKYDTMSYSLDATTGYTYKVADTTSLVPTVGLRYISVNEGGYTETGSAFNRTVTKKASDVLSGIFGGYVKQDVDLSGSTAVVEAHAFGNYDFTNKNAKISATLDGTTGSFDISPSKQNKFSYNLGLSANARMGMVEYGIGYDAKLADKFVSHQGTLRLRVDL